MLSFLKHSQPDGSFKIERFFTQFHCYENFNENNFITGVPV